MKRKNLTMLDAAIFYGLIIVGLILIMVTVATNFYDKGFQTAQEEQITTVITVNNPMLPVVYKDAIGNLHYKEVRPYGVRINWTTGYLEHYMYYPHTQEITYSTAKEIAEGHR